MEKKRRDFVKKCLGEYYEEDKKILIDPSICNVYVVKYIIGDLIYFGNQILIAEEDFETLEKFASCRGYSEWKEIRRKNAETILRKNTSKNFRIISLPEAENKVERKAKYLQENQDVRLYVKYGAIYQKLQKIGLEQQLYCMNKGMRDIGLFKTKYKFETIGAIQFENCKMMIYIDPIRESEIKVFDSKGRQKEGSVIEVKQNDFITIRSYKGDGVQSIKLYEIVSKHSKHHASLVLWTNLKAYEKTNCYIEQLPDLLQSIMNK